MTTGILILYSKPEKFLEYLLFWVEFENFRFSKKSARQMQHLAIDSCVKRLQRSFDSRTYRR
jgi:hypothetical protein